MSDERIDDLKSSDAGIRAAALEDLLGDIDDKLAEEMLKIAEDKDNPDEVRGDAMIGLGPIVEESGEDYDEDGVAFFSGEMGPALSYAKFQDICKRLRKIFEDESEPQFVRRRALESLIRDPKPWQKDAVAKLFASGDANWMRTALFAMGFVPGFDSEIMGALKHSNDEIVYEAVRAAGRREVKAASEVLEGFATSNKTDHDIRVESILALPYVHEDPRDLLDELSENTNAEIAEAAEAALEELEMLSSGAYDDEDEFEDDDEK